MSWERQNLNKVMVPLPSVSDEGRIEVVFRDVRKRLLEFLRDFDAIVGCMAYLTDQDFFKSISESEKLFSIITQDDPKHEKIAGPFHHYNQCIEYANYQDVTFIPALHEDNLEEKFGHGPLDYSPGWRFDPFYFFPKDVDGALLHHKFLVFLKKRLVVLDDSDTSWAVHPWDQRTIYLDTVAVWTGSFNLTKNANYSLENVVIIHSPKIAREYFREFFQIIRYLDGYAPCS